MTGTVNRDPKDPAVIQCYLHNCSYKIKTKTKAIVVLSLPNQLPPNFYSKL